jgi:hypothetical protein
MVAGRMGGMMKGTEATIEAAQQMEFGLDGTVEGGGEQVNRSPVRAGRPSGVTQEKARWWFQQIRESVERAQLQRRPVNEVEVPSGKWSIYADLQRVKVI